MSKARLSPIRRPRRTERQPRQPLLISVRDELSDTLHRRYRAGDRLPSEPDLAATYGVSRPTIREVLSGLEREGMVRRVHGVGTFVNATRAKVSSAVDVDLGVTETVAASRHYLGVRVLVNNVHLPPPEIAAQLGLGANDEVLWIERLILADDTPAAYVIDVVPQSIAATASEPYNGGSVYHFLEHSCSLDLLGGEARIDAVAADRGQSRLLRVAPGAALLRLSQVERTRQHVACLYSLEHYVPSVFDLTVRRQRRSLSATE
jgi:GntR family transcriptional regulator